MFITTTEKRFKLTDIISYIGVNESARRLIYKFICGFRKCHSVYSNFWEVPFVTTILNSEMFQVNTFLNFLFSLIGDKQAAEEIHSFPSLELSKHEIVWKQPTQVNYGINYIVEGLVEFKYILTIAFKPASGEVF